DMGDEPRLPLVVLGLDQVAVPVDLVHPTGVGGQDVAIAERMHPLVAAAATGVDPDQLAVGGELVDPRGGATATPARRQDVAVRELLQLAGPVEVLGEP